MEHVDDAPRPRAALEGIGRYRPGKAAETAMREHDIDTAIKLASNELPYGPLPAAERAVVEASERTRMVLITSPNNPTGTAFGRAELQHVLESVSPHTLVVLDEAYREFMTRADRPDPVALLAAHSNFVVLRTFSKAYGLAALRVGYAFAARDTIDALTKTLVPFTVNGLGQAAALASLAATDELSARLDAGRGERARVERELRAAGCSVPDPQANFVWLPAG